LRQRSILISAIVILAFIDLVIELQILPWLYGGIPLPFPETSKPIGDTLFSVTSLHMALIGFNLLVLMFVLPRTGYASRSIPSKSSDWLDLLAFLALAISGIVMWFYPVFMLVFLSAGIYLLLTEMR
jgi:hypothetical protein